MDTNSMETRALCLDGIRVCGHGGPGDLRLDRIVVAAVDANIVLTAVAKTPATPRSTAQGSVARYVPDVVCDLVVVGLRLRPAIAWDVAPNGDLEAVSRTGGYVRQILRPHLPGP
jgi:hypothetical protein